MLLPAAAWLVVKQVRARNAAASATGGGRNPMRTRLKKRLKNVVPRPKVRLNEMDARAKDVLVNERKMGGPAVSARYLPGGQLAQDVAPVDGW